MKALTVRNPWAWCIAIGAKNIENRGRNIPYRGPLAIHAAAGWSAAGAVDDRVIAELDRWRMPHERGERAGFTSVELAAFQARRVVAVVDLVDCHQADGGCCKPWGDDTYSYQADGSWSVPFHLVLDNPRRLQVPFPTTGRLGLWDVDDEQIRAAVPEPVGPRAVAS